MSYPCAELELIPEPLRKMAIHSRSKRKSHTLEDVRGSQIGSFENEALENEDRSTKHQNSKTKHPRQSPHVLSGVREWRADDNRYRKLEHTMIHDVQIQN